MMAYKELPEKYDNILNIHFAGNGTTYYFTILRCWVQQPCHACVIFPH